MAELKDSGNRREFETGAVRDIAEGKGRMDLVPIDIFADILMWADSDKEAFIYSQINAFLHTYDFKHLYKALELFTVNFMNVDIYTSIIEVSKHYEDGARKYSDNNWKKGIPAHCFVDSALRHLTKYFRGDTDEPHDRAFIWNILGLIWTLTYLPNMNDLPECKKAPEDSGGIEIKKFVG